MNDHIVVYRSEFEKARDEFWMDLINNNAETLYFLMQLFFWSFVAFVVLLVLFRFIPKNTRSDFERKRNRRNF